MKVSDRLLTINGAPGRDDGWSVHYAARRRQAAGEDIIFLTIGDHDTATPPDVIDAMADAARAGDTRYAAIPGKVRAMATLGVPYGEELERAEEMAREQAAEIFDRLVAEDPTYAGSDLADKEVTAMIAYLLRLGTDITKAPPEPEGDDALAQLER